ncbi:hypothetical protein ACJX0J_013774, partial [Zea mays]
FTRTTVSALSPPAWPSTTWTASSRSTSFRKASLGRRSCCPWRACPWLPRWRRPTFLRLWTCRSGTRGTCSRRRRCRGWSCWSSARSDGGCERSPPSRTSTTSSTGSKTAVRRADAPSSDPRSSSCASREERAAWVSGPRRSPRLSPPPWPARSTPWISTRLAPTACTRYGVCLSPATSRESCRQIQCDAMQYVKRVPHGSKSKS